ncbi:hypothetical protein TREMEDRAFT_65796 [Tremella mesenterica DSM 1558]|uniref:uncharacterized protein n=1 Tax=Tremella mesenterica (strain ATCC 24925 / CBS 8224 / DSM 1558 / NBRC 9311 / NRRL Y-6157 / RJB 2259-6 / UBC 559-6) TaxID=578456 RepID=UPI00032C4207|nr:uncharacterized protein TREMEDRAFT_65796 [Tremella mesenterica DSM 1558]EIW66190.1 hypothetical protein TREMEDRAFT_65796 [Tremella mesenterica DSM 1558]
MSYFTRAFWIDRFLSKRYTTIGHGVDPTINDGLSYPMGSMPSMGDHGVPSPEQPPDPFGKSLLDFPNTSPADRPHHYWTGLDSATNIWARRVRDNVTIERTVCAFAIITLSALLIREVVQHKDFQSQVGQLCSTGSKKANDTAQTGVIACCSPNPSLLNPSNTPEAWEKGASIFWTGGKRGVRSVRRYNVHDIEARRSTSHHTGSSGGKKTSKASSTKPKPQTHLGGCDLHHVSSAPTGVQINEQLLEQLRRSLSTQDMTARDVPSSADFGSTAYYRDAWNKDPRGDDEISQT